MESRANVASTDSLSKQFELDDIVRPIPTRHAGSPRFSIQKENQEPKVMTAAPSDSAALIESLKADNINLVAANHRLRNQLMTEGDSYQALTSQYHDLERDSVKRISDLQFLFESKTAIIKNQEEMIAKLRSKVSALLTKQNTWNTAESIQSSSPAKEATSAVRQSQEGVTQSTHSATASNLLEIAQSKITALTEELAALQARMEASERQQAQLRSNLDSRVMEINRLDKALELNRNWDKLSADEAIAAGKQREEKLSVELDMANKEWQSCSAELLEVKKDLQAMMKEGAYGKLNLKYKEAVAAHQKEKQRVQALEQEKQMIKQTTEENEKRYFVALKDEEEAHSSSLHQLQLSSRHIVEIAKVLEQRDAEITELNAQLETARKHVDQSQKLELVTSDNRSKVQQVQLLQQQFADLRNTVAQKNTEIHTLKLALSEFTNRHEEEVNEMLADIERHIATNAALSQELVDVVAQREELQTRCSTADSEVTIRMQQYGRAMEEKEHYKQELLKLSQSRSNFLQSANAKNPNNKEVSEQVAREMQAEKAALIAEINTLSMANSQTGTDLLNTKLQLQALQAKSPEQGEFEKMRFEFFTMQRSFAQLNRKCEQYQRQLDTAREEKDQVVQKLSITTVEKERLANEARQADDVLVQLQSDLELLTMEKLQLESVRELLQVELETRKTGEKDEDGKQQELYADLQRLKRDNKQLVTTLKKMELAQRQEAFQAVATTPASPSPSSPSSSSSSEQVIALTKDVLRLQAACNEEMGKHQALLLELTQQEKQHGEAILTSETTIRQLQLERGEVQEKVSGLYGRIFELESEQERIKSRTVQLDQQVAKKQKELHDVREECSRMRRSNEQMASALEEQQQDTAQQLAMERESVQLLDQEREKLLMQIEEQNQALLELSEQAVNFQLHTEESLRSIDLNSNQINHQQQRITKLEQQNKQAQQEKAALHRSLVLLTEENRVKTQECTLVLKDLDSMTCENQSLNHEASLFSEQHKQLQASIGDLTAKLGYSEEVCALQEQEQHDLLSTYQVCAAENAQWRRSAQELEEHLQQAGQQVQMLQNTITSLQARVKAGDEDRDRLVATIRAMDQQVTELTYSCERSENRMKEEKMQANQLEYEVQLSRHLAIGLQSHQNQAVHTEAQLQFQVQHLKQKLQNEAEAKEQLRCLLLNEAKAKQALELQLNQLREKECNQMGLQTTAASPLPRLLLKAPASSSQPSSQNSSFVANTTLQQENSQLQEESVRLQAENSELRVRVVELQREVEVCLQEVAEQRETMQALLTEAAITAAAITDDVKNNMMSRNRQSNNNNATRENAERERHDGDLTAYFSDNEFEGNFIEQQQPTATINAPATAAASSAVIQTLEHERDRLAKKVVSLQEVLTSQMQVIEKLEAEKVKLRAFLYKYEAELVKMENLNDSLSQEKFASSSGSQETSFVITQSPIESPRFSASEYDRPFDDDDTTMMMQTSSSPFAPSSAASSSSSSSASSSSLATPSGAYNTPVPPTNYHANSALRSSFSSSPPSRFPLKEIISPQQEVIASPITQQQQQQQETVGTAKHHAHLAASSPSVMKPRQQQQTAYPTTRSSASPLPVESLFVL